MPPSTSKSSTRPGRRFDPQCRDCQRLVAFREEVQKQHPKYHCRPVRPFGEPGAHLLVVGLAPGKHGANATGRPFTGDFAGKLLYATLHRFGFASKPVAAHARDGLRLIGCRVTNAVKCLPPDNKPVGAEIATCNSYLRSELSELPDDNVILALGTIAHNAVLRALTLPLSAHRFQHGTLHKLSTRYRLLDSYHCSRYNTQTRRLTPAMFEDVLRRTRAMLSQ